MNKKKKGTDSGLSPEDIFKKGVRILEKISNMSVESYIQLSEDWSDYNNEKVNPNYININKLSQDTSFDDLSELEKNIFRDFIDLNYEAKVISSKELEDSSGYGTDYWMVIHFPVYDFHVRVDGRYSSYSGLEYNSYKIVTPREETVIVYK